MTPSVGWLPFVADRRVASVRMRSLRPVDYLRRSGLNARIVGLGDLAGLDVLVLQKAYGEEPRAAAQQHRARGGAVVLDLCDNHLYNPTGDPVLAVRAEQLSRTIDVADVVSVCTPTLGEAFKHPRIVTVNDALDPPPRAAPLRAIVARVRRKPRVVWFGTAGAHNLPFGMRDLERIVPDLARVATRHPFELVVVSNSRKHYRRATGRSRLETRYLPWRPSIFALAAAAGDVAVLPVEINPFTRGKTSNRVATALGAGLAVVTDPLPSYLDYEGCVLFDPAGEGVLAYLEDQDLRARHVAAGQARTAEIYDPAVITAQWRRVFEVAIEARQGA